MPMQDVHGRSSSTDASTSSSGSKDRTCLESHNSRDQSASASPFAPGSTSASSTARNSNSSFAWNNQTSGATLPHPTAAEPPSSEHPNQPPSALRPSNLGLTSSTHTQALSTAAAATSVLCFAASAAAVAEPAALAACTPAVAAAASAAALASSKLGTVLACSLWAGGRHDWLRQLGGPSYMPLATAGLLAANACVFGMQQLDPMISYHLAEVNGGRLVVTRMRHRGRVPKPVWDMPAGWRNKQRGMCMLI